MYFILLIFLLLNQSAVAVQDLGLALYHSQHILSEKRTSRITNVFVAVFLGCTSSGRVGLCFLWLYVQELPKAQPTVVLVLKCLRRRGNGLKSHPIDWEKPGIEHATHTSQISSGFQIH